MFTNFLRTCIDQYAAGGGDAAICATLTAEALHMPIHVVTPLRRAIIGARGALHGSSSESLTTTATVVEDVEVQRWIERGATTDVPVASSSASTTGSSSSGDAAAAAVVAEMRRLYSLVPPLEQPLQCVIDDGCRDVAPGSTGTSLSDYARVVASLRDVGATLLELGKVPSAVLRARFLSVFGWCAADAGAVSEAIYRAARLGRPNLCVVPSRVQAAEEAVRRFDHKVDLSRCSLTQPQLAALVDGVFAATAPNVATRVLDLSGNLFNAAGAPEVARLVANYCAATLESLAVAGNSLQADGVLTILDAVGAAAATRLRALDLSGNFIGPKSAPEVAARLRALGVHWVSLGANALGDAGAAAAAEALLGASAPRFSYLGAAKEATAARAPGATRTLILSANGITDDGAKAVADVVARDTTLHELDLSNNHIGDAGVAALASAVAAHPTLARVVLTGNAAMTQQAVDALAQAVAANRALRVVQVTESNVPTATLNPAALAFRLRENAEWARAACAAVAAAVSGNGRGVSTAGGAPPADVTPRAWARVCLGDEAIAAKLDALALPTLAAATSAELAALSAAERDTIFCALEAAA